VENRPRTQALLVMDQETFDVQFRAGELTRLHDLADVGDPVRVDDLDEPELRSRLRDVDVLVTSWGCPLLTRDRLARMPKLQAVFHAAGTVRTFITDEVWRRNIVVTNAADENAIPVAEFTVAAIVLAGKKAPFLAQEARANRVNWWYLGGRAELSNLGRTIGVVGFSRTGRRVVERLQTLDVDVLVADPFANAAEVAALGAKLADLDDVLRASDILTLHAPELPSTHHLIGARELGVLPDGATIINTARGSIIDTAALEGECAAGRLDAILDVTDPEPLPADSPLYDLPNVMITPHIAGSLGSETRRMSNSALDELERFVTGQPPRSPVTPNDLAVSA
jgi:phosphoglycerate dehydrogenase-like enzyme